MGGKYIVIEGLDGAGTTTQSKKLLLALYDLSKANDTLLMCEPSMRTEEGKEIRRRLSGRLLEHEEETDDAHYWAKLFVNDRRQLAQTNQHLLEKGIHVISDRNMLSTFAYQPAQAQEEVRAELMDLFIQEHKDLLRPDLTIFLKVPVNVALERLNKDRKSMEFFDNILPLAEKCYEEAIQKVGKELNVVSIDGTKDIDAVAQEILEEVKKIL